MAKAGHQYDFRTANLWSVCQRDDVCRARRLLEEGLDLEMRNKVGWTPLHAAANGGAERVLRLLLVENAALEARCRAGRTALAEAARCGHLNAVKILARAGASLDAADNQGQTVLQSAKGTALRTWLEERLRPDRPTGAQDGSATSGRHPASGSGSKPERPSQGKREKRAERQPIGMSGKAKAKLLKEQRARRTQTRDADEPEVADHSEAPDGTSCVKASREPAAARAAAEKQHHAESPFTQPIRGKRRCLAVQSPHDCLGPNPCALLSAPVGCCANARHVLCLLLDARHPLLHASEGLVGQLTSLGVPVIICLSKSDLVPSSAVEEWKTVLHRLFPNVSAVCAVSTAGRRLDGVQGGVASRRRALHAALSWEARAQARRDAERLVAACGAELPPCELRASKRECTRARRRGRAGKTRMLDEDEECAIPSDSDGEEEELNGKAQESDSPRSSADEPAHWLGADGLEPGDTEHTQAPAAVEPMTVITLIGRGNCGKSSFVNVLADRRVVSVSHQPGHSRRMYTLQLSPTLCVRDTPALDVSPLEWTVFEQEESERPLLSPHATNQRAPWEEVGNKSHGEDVACHGEGAHVLHQALAVDLVSVLCGLIPTGSFRSPFEAVRLLAERVDLVRAYGLTPNELREAEESRDKLSPFGLCYALAAKKGFLQSRASMPDAHRAALHIIRDCAEGAIGFWSHPLLNLS